MITTRTRYSRRIAWILSGFARALAIVGFLALLDRAEATDLR